MKTERRHELQTNVLADWLGNKVASIKPYLKTIGIGCLAVVVAVGAYVVFSWRSHQKRARGWEAFITAARNSDVDGFDETVEAYGGSKPALWAKLSKANIELSNAAAEMAQDPVQAGEQLKKAITLYEEVEKAAPKKSMLSERARFALAVSHEYMAAVTPRKYLKDYKEYVAKAVAIYQGLKAEASKPVADAASHNLELLNKYASSEVVWNEEDPNYDGETWLSWLAQQNYKQPLGGNPHSSPAFDPNSLRGGSPGTDPRETGTNDSVSPGRSLLDEIGKGIGSGEPATSDDGKTKKDNSFPLNLNKADGDKKNGGDKKADDSKFPVGDDKKAPDKKAPDKKAPEKKAPEKKAPEKKAPEKKAPEKKAPEKKAPEKKAPEKKAPEKKAPEKKAPEKKAPEKKAP